jgi:hypothetical protein
MAVTQYENQPSTTVSSGGTDAPSSGSSESWTVASSSSFPAASSGASPPTQFHVADTASGYTSELIAVTNISGDTWTVTRGAESTTPVAHVAGFTITQVVSAGDLTALAVTGGDLTAETGGYTEVTATHLASPLPVNQGGTGTEAGAGQNDVFAGPSSGGAGAPSFRVLVASDLPAATTSAKGALQLDGTAGDIQPIGTSQVAGSNGLAADSGHSHPFPGRIPADGGLIAWSYDPAFAVNSLLVTGGTMYMAKIVIRQAVTITNLWFLLTTAQSSPTANENFILLYNSAGTTLLGNTASGAIDSQLTTANFVTHAMSSTYSAAAGVYWIGVLLAQTSGDLGRASGNTGSTYNLNTGSSYGSYWYATGGTGLLSSTPPSSVTFAAPASGGSICVGCS